MMVEVNGTDEMIHEHFWTILTYAVFSGR